jgi:hypothetical protein
LCAIVLDVANTTGHNYCAGLSVANKVKEGTVKRDDLDVFIWSGAGYTANSAAFTADFGLR